jgi:hypothetical protein
MSGRKRGRFDLGRATASPKVITASFSTVACTEKFSVSDILSDSVADYLKMFARVNHTTPEMMLAALLPTTAACLGPKTKIRMRGAGDHYIPCNLYLVGKYDNM